MYEAESLLLSQSGASGFERHFCIVVRYFQNKIVKRNKTFIQQTEQLYHKEALIKSNPQLDSCHQNVHSLRSKFQDCITSI